MAETGLERGRQRLTRPPDSLGTRLVDELERRDVQARAWLARHWVTALLLSAIVLIAFSFRITHVSWDEGQHLHPDERFLSIITSQISGPESIGQYFDAEASPLNPYNHNGSFVYGTFPLFLNKAVAEWLDRDPDGSTHASADAFRGALGLIGADFEHADGSLTFDGGYDSNRVGRVLSALFDTATVLLVFELGRVLFSRKVGLVAAGLLSITVLHIQYGHFFVSDTFLAFFVTATIYFAARIWRYGGFANYLLCGLVYGLALGTKLSAGPVLIVPALAILLRSWPQIAALRTAPADWRRRLGGRELNLPFDPLVLVPALGGIALLLVAGLTFRVVQPYAFDGPGFFDVFDVQAGKILSLDGLVSREFLKPGNYFAFSETFENDIEGLLNQSSGTDFPPNIQWIDRAPFLFPLGNIVLWGLGLPLALIVGGGLAHAGWRLARRADLAVLLPLLWVVFYFLFVGRGFNPTMRYLLPIYPAMVLLGGLGLVALWELGQSGRASDLLRDRWAGLRPLARPLLQGAAIIAVAAALLWALAFLGIYRQQISRVQASYWIAENIPAGSVLTLNEWDDGLPLLLPGSDPGSYTHVQLKPFAQDSPEKLDEFIAGLDQADYVIESSNRVYDSVTRVPARYPSMTSYYRALFDGSLGFEKVAEFTNYPRLLGIEIPDQGAEEAFSVYDHPKVTIWRKTAAYSTELAYEILDPEAAALAIQVEPKYAGENALLLRPDDLQTQRAGGTWDDVFSASGLAESAPLLLWFLVIEAAALAVTPIALLLFRRLPDRGYLLAKPLGLLLLAYPVWLLVSLKIVRFEQETVFWWLIALLGVGAVVAGAFLRQFLAALREKWALILFGELLFVAAFLALYELRLLNPDLWHSVRGGEKPMDLAYLTAVTRSTTLPPYDPWFAGGYINYYYLGQFFTATLTKLTAIRPEVAYNLAVPTFFALATAAAFSIAYSLAATARTLLRWRPDRRRIPAWSPVAAGLLGALFVTVFGNLDGIGQTVERLSEVSGWQVDTPLSPVDSVINSVGGLWQVGFHGAQLREFDYWRPSRMMPPTISITEFPYFTFLFADLHAHLMAIPFALLSIAAGLALALRRRGGDRLGDWALVVLLALLVGSLRWLNSWDYPPFLLLGLTAVLIGERHLEGGSWPTAARVVVKGGLLIVLPFLFYSPFLDNYHQTVTGLVGSPETTPLHQYLAHFGLFLAAVAGFLLYLLLRALRRSPLAELWRDGPLGTLNALDRLSWPAFVWVSGLVVVTFAAILWAAAYTADGKTVIAAMPPILIVIAYLAVREFRARRPDGGLRLYLLAMLGLAFGLSLGVDLVTIKGDIVRMNTVFKFYLHIWLLLGLVAAFAVWYLVAVAWSPSSWPPGRGRRARSPWSYLPRLAGSLTLGFLVIGALIYPFAATPARLDDRFADLPASIDGTDYMAVAVYGDRDGEIVLASDYEGIQWLRHNVEGTPAIIEGRSDLYHWGSRFSIYTGLPTVLGWDWHQKQQRGRFAYLVDERANQVEQFYADPEPAQALRTLRQYDVRYVIVGELERLYYPAAGLAKFAAGLEGTLEVAFENADLTIYRVRTDALLAAR